MPKLTKQLPSFSGVGAGQTATVRLPIGFTFEKVLLNYAFTNLGNILTQITGIRLVANGKPIMTISGAARLDSMNQFDGRNAASQAGSGILAIDFARYGMRTRMGEEFTRLGTGAQKDPKPITTLVLEVDIAGTATGASLSAKAIAVAPEASGLVKKIREFSYNTSGTGVFEIADLPRGAMINRIFFFGHIANVYKSLVIERDGAIIFDRSTAENEHEQSNGMRVPQADAFVYDPSEAGLAEEALSTAGVNDLRFKLDLTNSGAIPVLVEYIDVVGG